MKSREGYTNVCDDSGNDQLFAAGILHRRHEIVIVPGVDLARAGDERRVRKIFPSAQARSARSGPVFKTRRENRWQFVVFRDIRESQDIVLKLAGRKILHH